MKIRRNTLNKLTVLLSLTVLNFGYAQIPYRVTLQHEAGETTIEAKPTRIVTLSEDITELVAVLGEKPVVHATRRPVGSSLKNLTYVDIGLGRPTQGPLSDLFYMERFADALAALY